MQNKQELDEFVEAAQTILAHLLQQEYNPLEQERCSCGSGQFRLVSCRDCVQHKPTCEVCFLQDHRVNPFHWAHVWDVAGGFYEKRDISALADSTAALHLGHCGDCCPHPANATPIKYTIVHTNGIHATRVVFCGCPEAPTSKSDQLFRARLFPATMKDPRTALTFAVLKEANLHCLQSKKPAYDYYGALQRLTDNVLTYQVPVCALPISSIRI
jgi:hypothetical protein